ncbi:hypothetical protein BASA81_011272 [Batrachochytrium salamandrivorans]|nr:hypothetical protein BASA81_011272 [Batrachochytrium salamandrivorans]
MFKLLVLLGSLFVGQAMAAASYCDQQNVTLCQLKLDRDILFLVDGSRSMSEDRFYADVLNYTLILYCAFQEDQVNRAGMILFNERVELVIPIRVYTRTQWYDQVWTVKNSRGTANPACCSCCTPTADAFRLANETFNTLGATTAQQMAFVITDGLPSNNAQNTGGYPEWWWINPSKGFDPSLYNTRVVPTQANSLKDAGRRIILVGVPNALMVPPDTMYFNGGFPNGYSYCLSRGGAKFCTPYYTNNPKNFPITSLPISKNSFTTNTWGNQQLLLDLLDSVCAVAETPSPTLAPTLRPTTKSPTTKSPTTKAPTQAPTQSPVKPSLEQVDLTFLVDRSNSMNYVPQLCQSVLDTFPPINGTVVSSSPCWQLWTQFISNQARDFVAIPAGLTGNRALGWAADFESTPTTPARGLRINVIGFACTNKQKTPKIFEYSLDMFGGPITNAADFAKLIQFMRGEVLPTGGTCPHLAVEQAVKYVESADVARYPLQAVILMTDGVTYDGSATPKATNGLFAYKALTFGVGISVAKNGQNFGLTPAEIETQRRQLSAFVKDDPDYFYNLEEGWSGLLGITQTLANSLPTYFFESEGKPLTRYTWCGFRRQHNCASDNFRKNHCKWTGAKNGQYLCRKK